MLRILQRMSWTATFIIPVVLGVVVVLIGITQQQLPRIVFVIGFIFAMVFLPGILVAAKIFAAPRKVADVVLETIQPSGYVTLRFPDGHTESFQAHALNREVVMGKMTEGEPIRVTTRGDVVFKHERLGHNVEYWPDQTDP